MKRPSLTNLETICCIARLGTFVAAAEALGTTQPAISARVRDLEATLGIRLFQKRGRRLELTVQGRDFVERAEPVLHQVENLFLPLDNPAAASGVVRLGAGHVVMSWLPRLIVSLRRSMPNLCFELKVEIAPRLLDDLQAGRLDLAIVPGHIPGGHFQREELGYADMAWMAAGSLLPGRNRGFDADAFFRDHQVWSVPRESFMHARMLESLEQQGFRLNAISYCDNIHATIQMVEQGAGIGLLPQDLVQPQLASGALRVVPGTKIETLGFSVAWYRSERQLILSRIVEAAVAASTFRRRKAAR